MADMAMRVLERWQSTELLESKELHHEIIEVNKQDFTKTVLYYQQKDLKKYFKLRCLPSLMEFVGWLARKRTMDIQWLFDLLPIEEYYKDWEKLILDA